jgi:hypothetical protein
MRLNTLLVALMATYFVGTLAGMLAYFVLSDMPLGGFIYFLSLFGVPATCKRTFSTESTLFLHTSNCSNGKVIIVSSAQ